MNDDLRRSGRYADFLPITVTVNGNGDGKLLAGPFSARIADISNHGACLLLTQVLLHAFHLFHSTREKAGASLRLQIRPPHSHDSFLVAARPVWMQTEISGGIQIFRIGVDFLAPIDNNLLLKINKMLKRL